jgi:metal-responsive CopG/Arc/MetJ family transcriptional regulator
VRRITIPLVIRRDLLEEIELLAKKQNLSRSRLIENILEEHLLSIKTRKPKTTKEKVIHFLLTGDESVFSD